MATLLRLALNRLISKDPVWLCAVLGLLLLSACSRTDRQAVDRLNSMSYAYHYRDLDSTETYARRAYDLSDGYRAGRAEALNHLAFAHIARMEYDEAERLLNEAVTTTDNQIQQLVAYVQQMRLCQRRSRNREFHEYRELADRAIRRIWEERELLSATDSRNLLYAETEYAIVNSTYYYYVGLERQSIEALYSIEPDEARRDTAQYLNYLYNIGAGGIITGGTQQEINQQEFEHLLRCFILAQQGDYPYFAANALESLSEHLLNPAYRAQLLRDNAPAMQLLNPEHISDEMLPGWLADNALAIFTTYGDVYQIAGAYRTLASCHRQTGDYESALFNLEMALSDSTINQAPDLVASICEQLSVAYAAIDDKPMSDYYRNQYLDLQETTRQDRQLEARASQYERAAQQLNLMLAAVVVAIVLLIFFLWRFSRLNRKHPKTEKPDDLYEQRSEELAAMQLRVENSERRNLEQRAKVSLVNSITPFIDRIIHAAKSPTDESIGYIRELTDQINEYNDVLTHWIQLRQGELSLHIESFPLQPLFDMVAKGRTAFQKKGVELTVEPTDAVVKADRVLTLFMLNTLADNARKFTERGGHVGISSSEGEDYVEIDVEDSGSGMSPEQLERLFEAKPIRQGGAGASHGFGLLNCKGIIEKYRKMSQLFSVCTISATSEQGKGSRFVFRLPKGVVRMIVLLLLMFHAPSLSLHAQSSESAVSEGASADRSAPIVISPDDLLGKASAYADSAYFSNIDGNYRRTLVFADSCRHYLNQHYRSLSPNGHYLMLSEGNPSLVAPEIKWYHDGLETNYDVILDIRNESAVAALALHEWELYAYNNRIYTQLFKEMSADDSLGDYCRAMQQSQTNKTIAVILLILILVSILPAYYLLYYRHRLYDRFLKEQQRQTDMELLEDELHRAELEDNNLHVANAVLDNCLSTLKHETMYYPSRISQLLDEGDMDSLREVADYYRALYGILSQQAMRQVEPMKLRLKPLEGGILGDEHLIRYLFEILRKQSGQKKLDKQYIQKEEYVDIHVLMPQLRLTEEQARDLFTPSKDRIPYLLCRQIVRDHGEATNRRGCGIRATITDNIVNIIITLPSVWKNSR